MKLAFADTYRTSPTAPQHGVRLRDLLDDAYLASRAKLIDRSGRSRSPPATR